MAGDRGITAASGRGQRRRLAAGDKDGGWRPGTKTAAGGRGQGRRLVAGGQGCAPQSGGAVQVESVRFELTVHGVRVRIRPRRRDAAPPPRILEGGGDCDAEPQFEH